MLDVPAGRRADGLAVAPLHAKAERPAEVLWSAGPRSIAVFQRVNHPDPVQAADMARAEIEGGASGITLVLAGAHGAHGCGLACRTPADLATIVRHVDLETSRLRFDLPVADDGMSALLGDALEMAGLRIGHPNLDLAADPLTAAIATGRDLHAVTGSAQRWACGLAERGVAAPPLRVDGRPHHDAGGTDVQELAALLSTGVLYLRALEAAGTSQTGEALRFVLVADTDQNLTVAKFRALRRLWARVEQACGRPPTPVRLHGETSGRMLARRDPWTNLLRNAIACAGAIIGGADSVTVLPFTGALGLPDAFARRLARNTPLVLTQEAHLGLVADAGAGSGALEALTDLLCAEAWRLFQDLEAGGGLVEALAAGRWRREIEAARRLRAARVATGCDTLVGVTAFAPAEGAVVPPVLLPHVTTQPGADHGPLLPAIRDAEGFEDVAAVPGRKLEAGA